MVRKLSALTAFVSILATLPLANAAMQQQPAAAPDGAFTADAVHSSVLFRIKHFGVSYFHGRFNKIEGTFTLDPDDATKCSFDMKVPVESLDTNNEDRDKHLLTAEYFNSDEYPYISFKGRGVKKTGENTFEVKGDLTLLAVTKPITIEVEHVGTGPGMQGGTRCGFETTFTIKRSDFGMTSSLDPIGDSKIRPLGDEVRLTIAVEGARK